MGLVFASIMDSILIDSRAALISEVIALVSLVNSLVISLEALLISFIVLPIFLAISGNRFGPKMKNAAIMIIRNSPPLISRNAKLWYTMLTCFRTVKISNYLMVKNLK
jgi:hypothetical protein